MSTERIKREQRVKWLREIDFREEEGLKVSKKEGGNKSDTKYVELGSTFQKMLSTNIPLTGTRPFYNAGKPHVEGGGTIEVTGNFRWTHDQFARLVEFVARNMDPSLISQIVDKVGEAGFQQLSLKIAKKIADFTPPDRYSTVLGDNGGKKTS